MSRWIDADELLKKQTTMTQYDEGGWDMQVRAVTVEDIENASAIDPESLRPRGRWEILTDDFDCEYMRCTCCKEEFYPVDEDTVDSTPKFCSNCGAKMEDDDEA